MFESLKIDGYWYLATPYAKYENGHALAFTHAAMAAAALLKAGVAIFCPITHSHPIATIGNMAGGDHDIWMPLDQHFMNGAHGIIVVKMPGWKDSKGVQMELDYFGQAGKPIVFLSWPELKLGQ